MKILIVFFLFLGSTGLASAQTSDENTDLTATLLANFRGFCASFPTDFQCVGHDAAVEQAVEEAVKKATAAITEVRDAAITESRDAAVNFMIEQYPEFFATKMDLFVQYRDAIGSQVESEFIGTWTRPIGKRFRGEVLKFRNWTVPKNETDLFMEPGHHYGSAGVYWRPRQNEEPELQLDDGSRVIKVFWRLK